MAKANKAKASQDWREWVKKATQKGAKHAHRFANRLNKPPVIFDEGKRPETLNDKANHQRTQWEKKWRSGAKTMTHRRPTV